MLAPDAGGEAKRPRPAERLAMRCKPSIEPGYRANLVLADDRLNVLQTLIDGQAAT